MDLMKVYYDINGDRKSILQMVRADPEWAANRIQAGEDAIDKLNATRTALLGLVETNTALLGLVETNTKLR